MGQGSGDLGTTDREGGYGGWGVGVAWWVGGLDYHQPSSMAVLTIICSSSTGM